MEVPGERGDTLAKHVIRLCLPVMVLGLLALPSPSQASSLPPGRLKVLREQAEFFERQADWERACETYDAILKFHRTDRDKNRYLNCLRRCFQVRRHRDPSFRKEVLGLDYGQAMRLHELVADALLDNSLERKRVQPAQLFRKGMEELHWALESLEFCQAHLPAARPTDIRDFQKLLKRLWGGQTNLSREEARIQVREVALAASAKLQLNATTVIMEFTCGACYALDDYTAYLTPTELRILCDSLKGEVGSAGLILASRDGGKLIINDVQQLGPAAEVMPSLLNGQVVSIDKRPADQFTLEGAQQALEGATGSTVELSVSFPGVPPRTIMLQRRPVPLTSVYSYMLTDTVGYIQIGCFQETTLRELDQALGGLSNMKALVLDLRGNGGGLFEVAIDSARRFLAQGIIASTQSVDPKYNTVYQSRNPAAMTLPLVVLIDGDTASAAEVLAGALKENRRGRLVGQTTFGKGCTQTVFRLPPAPGGVPTGGLRITVARFFSPTGSPYAGRGIVPHLLVEPVSMPGKDNDPQLEEARSEALRLLNMSR
jgi:carboxyl-terminal processing protease